MNRKEKILLASALSLAMVCGPGFAEEGERCRKGQSGKAHFDRIDENGDGEVSADEFVLTASHRVDRIMEHMDSDENGVISAEEFAESRSRRDQRRSDDRSSEREGRRPRGGTPPAFGDLDVDGDGQLTEDELLAHHAERVEKTFSRLDKNEDGVLTSNEMRKLRRHRGGRGHEPGSGPDRDVGEI